MPTARASGSECTSRAQTGSKIILFGELNAAHYEDETARDPRLDPLREKMEVIEDERYSRDYLDPSKPSIAKTELYGRGHCN